MRSVALRDSANDPKRSAPKPATSVPKLVDKLSELMSSAFPTKSAPTSAAYE